MLMAPALAVAAWALRDYVLIENLQTVEAGSIFRGAEQKTWPLRRLIKKLGIRTVVCLVNPETNERFVAEAAGAQWLWIPMGDSSAEVTFDALDKLADILAHPSNRPVFFHCRRGVYRSNLGQAVYRMRWCGWTLQQALDELRVNGYDPAQSGGDLACAEFLAKYYRERIQSQCPTGN